MAKKVRVPTEIFLGEDPCLNELDIKIDGSYRGGYKSGVSIFHCDTFDSTGKKVDRATLDIDEFTDFVLECTFDSFEGCFRSKEKWSWVNTPKGKRLMNRETSKFKKYLSEDAAAAAAQKQKAVPNKSGDVILCDKGRRWVYVGVIYSAVGYGNISVTNARVPIQSFNSGFAKYENKRVATKSDVKLRKRHMYIELNSNTCPNGEVVSQTHRLASKGWTSGITTLASKKKCVQSLRLTTSGCEGLLKQYVKTHNKNGENDFISGRGYNSSSSAAKAAMSLTPEPNFSADFWF